MKVFIFLVLVSGVSCHENFAKRRSTVALRQSSTTTSLRKTLVKKGGENGGTMGKMSAINSLVKTIIGGGMLALPAGMAAGKGTGIAPACIIVLCHALLSAYTYDLVGRAVAVTGARDFGELWTAAFGASRAWLIDAMVGGVALGAILTYGCFCGELLTQLAAPTGIPLFATRNRAMLVVAIFPLLPLALARDLSGLKASSLVGIAAVLLSAVVIAMRALDGTYLKSGIYASAAAPPAWSSTRISLGTCVLFNMLSTAYMAHTNAVRAYRELAQPKDAPFVAACAFGLSALLYAVVMLAGYLTFGNNPKGLILANFHSQDFWALATKVATLISIISSHPLLFTSLRDAVLSLSGLRDKASKSFSTFATVSITLLATTILLSALVPDAGFIVAINGASVGALLIFLPCLIYLKVAPKNLISTFESNVLKSLFGFGAFVAVFGTVVTCLEAFTDLLA